MHSNDEWRKEGLEIIKTQMKVIFHLWLAGNPSRTILNMREFTKISTCTNWKFGYCGELRHLLDSVSELTNNLFGDKSVGRRIR